MEKLVHFQCHGIIAEENVILMPVSLGPDTMAYTHRRIFVSTYTVEQFILTREITEEEMFYPQHLRKSTPLQH